MPSSQITTVTTAAEVTDLPPLLIKETKNSPRVKEVLAATVVALGAIGIFVSTLGILSITHQLPYPLSFFSPVGSLGSYINFAFLTGSATLLFIGIVMSCALRSCKRNSIRKVIIHPTLPPRVPPSAESTAPISGTSSNNRPFSDNPPQSSNPNSNNKRNSAPVPPLQRTGSSITIATGGNFRRVQKNAITWADQPNSEKTT